VLAARAPGASELHAYCADFRDPGLVLADPWVRARLDLPKPVGVLLLGMLDFIGDEDRLVRALAVLKGALAPGSLLVMVYLLEGMDPTATECALRESPKDNPFQYTPRPLERLRQPVSDFEFVDPGFVPCTSWRQDGRGPGQDLEARCAVAGGVAIVQ
jgi:hypothetical protein